LLVDLFDKRIGAKLLVSDELETNQRAIKELSILSRCRFNTGQNILARESESTNLLIASVSSACTLEFYSNRFQLKTGAKMRYIVWKWR
jgi:hypothetical protein